MREYHLRTNKKDLASLSMISNLHRIKQGDKERVINEVYCQIFNYIASMGLKMLNQGGKAVLPFLGTERQLNLT